MVSNGTNPAQVMREALRQSVQALSGLVSPKNKASHDQPHHHTGTPSLPPAQTH